MKVENNTILITGGATGIGLAFAIRFLKAGSRVIVCGRREDKLREHPTVNVLVNNAGIQRRVPLAQPESWEETRQ